MSVNHAKEFLKSILFFNTFLPERHMAPTIPILKKKISKGIGLYCSVQLFGMQKLLFDWNFKPRAFLGSPGPPLLVGSSIHLKSL